MVFDGAGEATAKQVVAPAPPDPGQHGGQADGHPAAAVQPVPVAAAPEPTNPSEPASAPSSAFRDPAQPGEARPVDHPEASASTSGRHEIAFIENDVTDWQDLAASFGPNVRVVILDSTGDGLAQMAAALEGEHDVDAIHLVTHGAEGRLDLGTATLDEASMQGRYREDLETIGRALSSDGDILVYGCDFTLGDDGLAAAQTLSRLTGADVAGSDDPTGSSKLGGDYVLETQVGHIESQVGISQAEQERYAYTLNAAAQIGTGSVVEVVGKVIYNIDTVTAKATPLTTIPNTIGGLDTGTGANALAIDQTRGLIYFSGEGSNTSKNALYAYDYLTAGLTEAQRYIVIDSDLTDNGVTVGTAGTQSGGASAYGGNLYIGVEANFNNASQGTIYKINLASDGRSVLAGAAGSSVIAHTNNASSFGDLAVNGDGTEIIVQQNPTQVIQRYRVSDGTLLSSNTSPFAGQAARDQGGNYYILGAQIAQVDPTTGNVIGTQKTVTTDGTTALGAPSDAGSWTPPTASVGDRIFNDKNANGTQDAGEAGIAGVTVQLIDDVNNNGVVDAGERILATDTTGSNGGYLFTGLVPGNYLVRVTDTNNVLGGDTPTTGTAVRDADILAIGASNLGVDIGYQLKAPTVDLNGASQAGNDFAATYVENATAVAIADASAVTADADSQNLVSGQIILTNKQTNDFLALNGTQLFDGSAGTLNGIAYSVVDNGSTVTMNLSGTATKATYDSFIRSVGFGNTSETPNGTVVRAITVQVNDGYTASNVATSRITVQPVDDPPVDGDETNSTPEDTTLTVAAGTTGALLNNASDADGDALSITQFVVNGTTYTAGQTATIAGVGTLEIDADGSYSFVPAANYNGSVPVATYTVSDGNGGTDTSRLTLTVTPVNDPPVDGNEVNSTPEDTTLTVAANSANSLLANASDVEGDSLSITQFVISGQTYAAGQTATIAGVGALRIGSDGSYTFTPAANYHGSVPVATYTVSDGHGGTDTSTLTLSVASVNDPPADGDESVSTNEDTSLNVAAAGGLLANATDVDGDTLTVTRFVVNGTTYASGSTATISGVGTLRINADGSYVFTPGTNYNGTVPVATYTVSDGHGGTDTSTLTITVIPVNDPPVDGNETNATPEDTTLDVAAGSAGALLNNASDVDGDTLSITQFVVNGTTYTAGQAATVAGVGTLTINADGSYRFVPAANYNGSVPVATYTVSDGNGGTDTSTLTLTVTPVNDPPVDGNETGSTLEDTTLTVAAGSGGALLTNASDADGDTLTITQFSVAGASYTAGQSAAIAGIGTLTINADGSYRFVPAQDYNGNVPVATYTVSDGRGGTDTSTLTLTVTPVNDPPVDADETNTTPEDTTLVVAAGSTASLLTNASDVDGDTPTITQFVVSGTTYTAGQTATLVGVGTLQINADGSYRFVPAQDYNGSVPVATYTVSDGNGGTDTSTLTLTVTPVNDPPVDGDETNSTPEDTTLSVAAGSANALLNNATDVDGDALSITQFVVNGTTYTAGQAAAIAGVGTLTIGADGSYSFTPAADYNGTVPVATYTVSDGHGGTDTSTLTLTVTPVDDPPAVAGNTDGPVAGSDAVVRESDLSTGTNPNGTGETAGGTFTISSRDGLQSLTVGGTTITASQLVNSANAPITIATPHGEITIDGYSGTTGLGATGTVSYSFALTQAADSVATPIEQIAVVVTDQQGDQANATLGIQIVDDTPIARNESDQAANRLGSSTATGNVVTGIDQVGGDPNSTDGVADTIGADARANPVTGVAAGNGTPSAANVGAAFAGAHGTLTLNSDGSYTYQPDYGDPAVSGLTAQQTITDTFTYQVSDADGSTATARLTITIYGTPAIMGTTDGAVAGTDGTVLESDLSTGSDAAGPGETLAGTFQIVPTPGVPLDSLVVDGRTITAAELAASGTAPITVATANGSITLDGYDTTSGVVDYSYTLGQSVDHSGGPQVDPISLSVVDTQGNRGNGFLNIAIQDDVPTAGPDQATIDADATAPATGSVLGNDQQGADRTTTPVSGVATGTGTPDAANVGQGLAGTYGTLTLNADGTYGYAVDTANPAVAALHPGQTLTDTYSYQITDSDGDTSTTTLTITIDGVNHAPADGNETAAVTEDTPLVVPAASGLLANATDSDGDTPTISGFAVDTNADGTPEAFTPGQTATIAGVGALTIAADGSYRFDPAQDYNGPVPAVTYTVSDGHGGTDISTLSLSVTAVNDAPVDGDETNSTPEDTVLNVAAGSPGSLLANATDVDGDTPTITQFVVSGTTYAAGQTATIAGVGTLTVGTDGSYRFDPASNYNGAVPAVTYTVSDGHGGTDTSTLSLSVTAVNDAPVDGDETASTPEDTSLVVPASSGLLANASDPEGDPLTVSGFAVDTNGDGTPEVFTPGQSATIAGVGTLTIASDGSYRFDPAPNYNGAVPAVSYTVSDGHGGTDTSTLSLSVTAVNDAPVDGDETASTPEDTSLVVPAASGLLANASDPEGDPITVSRFAVDTDGDGTPEVFTPGQSATIAGVGTLTIASDGSYRFDPAPNHNGAVPAVSYTVSDGHGGQAISTLTLSTTPVNDAPVDGDETTSTPEDTALVVPAASGLLANATDVDGDPLAVTQFAVDTDGDGTPEIFAPGQSATITGVGTLTIAGDGSYRFDPASNYNGPVPTVSYSVSDGHGGTDTSMLTLSVTAVNDAPVDGDETATTPEDTALVVPAASGLLANATDADGDPLSVTQFAVDTNQDGTLEVFTPGQSATITGVGTLTIAADGSYRFDPASNYNGPVPAVSYTVSDGHGGTDTSMLTLSVTAVNDAPVDGDETASAPEDTALVVPAASGLLANASDPEGDPLTVAGFAVDTNGDGTTETFAPGQSATIAGIGTLTIAADGSYRFDPAANYNGALPAVSYAVSDGHGGQALSTLSLSVTPVNDTPVDGDETAATPEDTPLVVPAASGLLANASDVDGDPLSISGFAVDINGDGTPEVFGPGQSAVIAGGGTLAIAADGSYRFDPAPNYDGAVPFVTYTVSDGHGGTDTSRLSLSVTPVNDAPVDGDETATTQEDTPLVVPPASGLLANASDVDGDPLSISGFAVDINGDGTPEVFAPGQSATIAGVGTLTIGVDGSYRFDPAAGYSGPVPAVTYRVSDGHGGEDSSTLGLSVTHVNHAPMVRDDTGAVAADTPLSGNLLANDTDPDGDRLTVAGFTVGGQVVAVPPNGSGAATIAGIGTLTVGDDGGYTFVPAQDYAGPVPTVTYRVSDGALAGSAHLDLVVMASATPARDRPVLVDDLAPVTEDTRSIGNVLSNDRDPGGDPLRVTSFTFGGTTYAAGTPATIAGVGTLLINPDGSYVFTPVLGAGGAFPDVTYTATDGKFTAAARLALVPARNVQFYVAPEGLLPALPELVDPDAEADLFLQPGEDPIGIGPTVVGPIFVSPNDVSPIGVDMIVVDTVESAGGISSVVGNGAIDRVIELTANRLGNLGGMTFAGETGVATPIETTIRQSLQGSSDWLGDLRLDLGLDDGDGDGGDAARDSLPLRDSRSDGLLLETEIRAGQLSVALSGPESRGQDVVGYEISMADGAALPPWLARSGATAYSGYPPADAAPLDIEVAVTHRDGQILHQRVRIDPVSGHMIDLDPTPVPKRLGETPALIFSRQLAAARSPATDICTLEKAIGFR